MKQKRCKTARGMTDKQLLASVFPKAVIDEATKIAHAARKPRRTIKVTFEYLK